MKNRKNIIKLAGLLALSVAGVSALVSCGGNNDCSTSSEGPSNAPVYTINFYAQGSSTVIQPIKAKAGAKITAPDINPRLPGYKFIDWHEHYHNKIADYEHSSSEKAFSFDDPMPARNVTLYAHFAKEGGGSATDEELAEYKASLKANSQPGHLYYHYYRYGHAGYNDWDVWAWPYKPTAGEGTRFDWNGRTTSADRMSATGDANYDKLGGAYVDIDLTKHYKAGWDDKNKKMLDLDMTFEGAEQVGLQIVKSSTRDSSSGFWVNDGSDVYIRLKDYEWELDGGGVAYHVFVMQDNVFQQFKDPITDVVNPFDDDDGTNVTYGNKAYDNVNWGAAIDKVPTSDDFKTVGAGYQIQVSSFADSDGDGFGDIFGIVEKLDYIKGLGVKALWLTPIQLSGSYHGYDITDYEKVDPKFGSSKSPAGIANGGEVTSETALEDYKMLLKECEKEGIKVVMDLVLNHTSMANTWFTSSANLDPDYRGYYQWGNNETQKSNINEDKYWYPYNGRWYSYYAKFGSAMPELNYSFKATREAVENMSAYWVNLGVSGFRLDAVKHIYMLDEAETRSSDTKVIDETKVNGRTVSYSSNLTKNLNFFKELKAEVSKKTGKNVFFVGENFDGHAYHVAPYYEAFDSMFDFYAYFNLTSGAATGLTDSTNGYGTVGGWLNNPAGTFTPGKVSTDSAGNRSGDEGGTDFNLAANGVWDFPHVYEVYNKYRVSGGGSGQVSLPGAFTSNHDIARVINRIHGSGSATGINKQGNVTTGDYALYEKSANLVKIAEVLLPGVTWVYYGDEIGMTGNFPDKTDSQSSYADLWYRQPMKWKTDGGEKGDEYGTTDYYVTGSGMKVEWDNVNKTSTVKGGLDQMGDQNSDYSILAKFIKAKNADPSALVTGNIAFGNWVNGMTCSNVLTFSRNNDQYRVVVNFNKTQAGQINGDAGFNKYDVVVSFNGATTSSIPAMSAMLLKRK